MEERVYDKCALIRRTNEVVELVTRYLLVKESESVVRIVAVGTPYPLPPADHLLTLLVESGSRRRNELFIIQTDALWSLHYYPQSCISEYVLNQLRAATGLLRCVSGGENVVTLGHSRKDDKIDSIARIWRDPETLLYDAVLLQAAAVAA